jgi:hypothetical protein
MRISTPKCNTIWPATAILPTHKQFFLFLKLLVPYNYIIFTTLTVIVLYPAKCIVNADRRFSALTSLSLTVLLRRYSRVHPGVPSITRFTDDGLGLGLAIFILVYPCLSSVHPWNSQHPTQTPDLKDLKGSDLGLLAVVLIFPVVHFSTPCTHSWSGAIVP